MIQEAETLFREYIAYVRDRETQENILSLYLVVDPSDKANQVATPGWQVALKNGIAEIESGIDRSDRAARERWQQVKGRMEDYMGGYRPAGKSLVLFVGPFAELGLELPVRLTNHVHYGWPHISEFVWALDEYEQYGVVLFGQDQARALRIYLGGTDADVMVEPDQTWSRAKGRPTHYTQYDRRQQEFDQRYLRMLANRINQYFITNDNLERIIFGGNVQMGHAVRSLLHPSVAEAVIAILPIPFTAKEHEIPAAIQDVALQYEREHEVAVVDELIRGARLGQRGVLGLDAVTRALELHAVRLLILPYPVQTVLTEKLLMRAAQSSSDVEFVSGEAATRMNEAGGVGALLYYGLPSGIA